MPEIADCKKCGGTGQVRRETCPTCKGKRKVIIDLDEHGKRIIKPAERRG